MLSSFEDAWKPIIMAPKTQYYDDLLGMPVQIIKGVHVQHHRFQVKSRSGLTLQCSLFTSNNNGKTVIYLHSHSGNRLEGIPILPHLVPDFNYCLFDFAGCGNSQGEFVTLGIKESQDIANVIHKLRGDYHQSQFYLWGRSMGAVAAMLFSHKQRNMGVQGQILDSPFTDTKTMVSSNTISFDAKLSNIKLTLVDL